MNWLAVAAVLVAGVALSVQAPLNAALSRGLGSPVAAAAVSFLLGFLILAVLAFAAGQGGSFARVAGVPAWQLAGGALGALYVTVALWSVQSLGAVTMLGALVLGQIVGAMAIDATGAFGVPLREIGPSRILAAALVLGGLLLSRL